MPAVMGMEGILRVLVRNLPRSNLIAGSAAPRSTFIHARLKWSL